MNGWATFEGNQGVPFSINVDNILFVRPSNNAVETTMIFFSKDHYVQVKGSPEQVLRIITSA